MSIIFSDKVVCDHGRQQSDLGEVRANGTLIQPWRTRGAVGALAQGQAEMHLGRVI